MLNDDALRDRLLASPPRRNYILVADSIFNETTDVATTKLLHVSDAERQRSRALSTFRVCVEHSFADLKNYFAKLSFGNGLRWQQQLLEPIIIISILLSNCRVCLARECLTSRRFAHVPTLAQYLDAKHDVHTLNLLNSYL